MEEIIIDKVEIVDEEEKKSEEFIYQIFSGTSEDEFYSFIQPQFLENEVAPPFLFCKNLIIKKQIESEIGGKVLSVDYASNGIEEMKFDLKGGVVVKVIPITKANWLSKKENEAHEEMKEMELKFYREVFPKILQQINKNHDGTINKNSKFLL